MAAEPIFVGIDPGLDGGIACISHRIARCWPLPTVGKGKYRELDLKALEAILRDSDLGATYAAIEHVHAMPKQGVSSTFRFGDGYGQIKGLLAGLGISYTLVRPQRWKKVVLDGLGWQGDKEASVRYCIARWPDLSLLASERCRKPHDGMADALCIAEWRRRQG